MNNGTQLNGRILWYDGDSSFDPEALYDLILSGHPLDSSVFVTSFNKDVRQFNSLNPDCQLTKKSEITPIDVSWNIPEKYKKINVSKYIYTKLLKELESTENFNQDDIDERIKRVDEELQLYEKYNLIDILKVVIYIVEKFEENGVVWGTGRGSSCCSYCLYLIGLHDVDSIKYGLELSEFFR
jgi:DNA polymerase III alpha subunit